MRSSIALMLSLVCFSACAENKGLEHKARAASVSFNYIDCVQTYAETNSASSASPSEIGAGAKSECRTLANEYRGAMLDYARKNVTERQAIDLADNVTQQLEASSFDDVVKTVIETRASAADD